VTVSAGSSSASWTVFTNPVTTSTTVQLTATANGVTKTGLLTIR
jgi:hypothetical protein